MGDKELKKPYRRKLVICDDFINGYNQACDEWEAYHTQEMNKRPSLSDKPATYQDALESLQRPVRPSLSVEELINIIEVYEIRLLNYLNCENRDIYSFDFGTRSLALAIKEKREEVPNGE